MCRSQSQSRLETPAVRPYNQVKEEQIKISQDRANFHSRAANLVAKSPQPFRRGLSETRTVAREDRQEREQRVVREQRAVREQRVVREPTSTESLLSLNDNQKAKLIQVKCSPVCLSGRCNCGTLSRFYWSSCRLMWETSWWRRGSPASTPAVCTASQSRYTQRSGPQDWDHCSHLTFHKHFRPSTQLFRLSFPERKMTSSSVLC